MRDLVPQLPICTLHQQTNANEHHFPIKHQQPHFISKHHITHKHQRPPHTCTSPTSQGQGAGVGAPEAAAGKYGACVPQLRAVHHRHPPALVCITAAQQHQRGACGAAAVLLHLPHALVQVPDQAEGGGACMGGCVFVHMFVQAAADLSTSSSRSCPSSASGFGRRCMYGDCSCLLHYIRQK
eukprot:1157780-Pelagomonas_calceolata.AAC.13